ncbi:MAG: helix-turn-helix domain-containing protein [Chitinophagaceae bacterium]|nr:helix-turn-helix domain-containing protein [Chitinophagaceae bacterium]
MCHVAWLSKTLKCSRNKAHKILEGKKKSLNVNDLSIICYHLNCKPDVFFQWNSSSKYKLSENHVLRELIPPPRKIIT